MLAYLLASTIAATYGHCGPYGARVIVDLDFDKVTVPRTCRIFARKSGKTCSSQNQINMHYALCEMGLQVSYTGNCE